MSEEPDFSEFDDWLDYRSEYSKSRWLPPPSQLKKKLLDDQKKIVEENVRLFSDFERWKEKATAFDSAIKKIEKCKGKGEADSKRSKYLIRFDSHDSFDCDLSYYFFPCSVSFAGAKFHDSEVSFQGTMFAKGDVWFSGAQFVNGEVLFELAEFSEGEVNFDGAQFGKGKTSFIDIDLSSSDISFQDVTVIGNFSITSFFPKEVSFEGLSVEGSSRFSGSEFNEIPDFRNAIFARPPEVSGMTVPAPNWMVDGPFQNF